MFVKDNVLINDALETMDIETKAEFDKQMDTMKNKIIIMEDNMPTASVIAKGNFKPRAHGVEGKAILIEHLEQNQRKNETSKLANSL